MNVAVVKYNAGNIESVKNALNRLGVEPIVSDNPEILKSADRVIFPGVGEASTAMDYLRDRKLDSTIKSLAQPLLGICLGMQLLCENSEENSTQCLGIIPSRVRRFPKSELKVPQIGWNNVFDLKGKLFEDIAENSYMYFVHGFYVENGTTTSAECDYGVNFSAAIEYKNIFAVQFHPEKSGAVGSRILENFLKV